MDTPVVNFPTGLASDSTGGNLVAGNPTDYLGTSVITLDQWSANVAGEIVAMQTYGWLPGELKMYAGVSATAPSGWLWADSTAYSRSTYSRLFAAITVSVTGTTASGNATVTAVSSIAGIEVGHPICGPGIPTGTKVTAVGSTTLTLSANATASATVTLVIAPYGVGDGSTTFNVPDFRQRVPLGWGGSSAGSGLTQRALGTAGGEETHTLLAAELASHTHGVSDPTHNHSHGDPGHAHSVYDPTHAHSISDPGHAHSVYDPSHEHGMYATVQDLASGGIAIGTVTSPAQNRYATTYAVTNIGIYAAGTGIGIYGAYTGIGIYAAVTGIYNVAAATGISIQSSGSGTAHNNMQPYLVCKVLIKI